MRMCKICGFGKRGDYCFNCGHDSTKIQVWDDIDLPMPADGCGDYLGIFHPSHVKCPHCGRIVAVSADRSNALCNRCVFFGYKD